MVLKELSNCENVRRRCTLAKHCPLLITLLGTIVAAARTSSPLNSGLQQPIQPCTGDQQCLGLLSQPPKGRASRCLAGAPKGRGLRCVTDHFPHNDTCACGFELCNKTVVPPQIPGKQQLLVIGDSISFGWQARVQANLTQWQVTHAGDHPDNGFGSRDNNGNTNWIRHCLDGWLTTHPDRWDLILINAGLHDLASDNQHVALPTYSILLAQSISLLQARTKAKIVWLSTTPVPTDPPMPLFPRRLQSDVMAYNNAAEIIVAAENLRTCDLFAAVTAVCGGNYSTCPLQKESGIHFEVAGWNVLAAKVLNCIMQSFSGPRSQHLRLDLKSDDSLAQLTPGATQCPAAPAGYTLFPNHCVGGPGKTCSGELKTGHCRTTATCVTAALAACTGSCHAFAIAIGGATCDGKPAGGQLRWHTFNGGNASVVPK